MSSLTDKVIIITGASSGIGAAIGIQFAKQGTKLVLTGRNVKRLQSVADQCEQTGLTIDKIHQIVADITTEEGVNSIIDGAIRQFGKIDVLVNNAGFGCANSIENTDMKVYEETFRINLWAPFNLTRLAFPHLKRTKGNIINISSASSTKVVDGFVTYSMTKAGLDHLTRCAASEFGPDGIRVNSVQPGTIDTGMLKRSSDITEEQIQDVMTNWAARHSLKRIGQPDEVASVVVFLASDAASFMTGSLVNVDGGIVVNGNMSDIGDT